MATTSNRRTPLIQETVRLYVGIGNVVLALDPETGEELWRENLGGQVASGPMSYELDGKQYIAVSAGGALFVYTLPD